MTHLLDAVVEMHKQDFKVLIDVEPFRVYLIDVRSFLVNQSQEIRERAGRIGDIIES